MAGPVSYQFKNGWVATGDLPCRKALREEVASRTVHLPDLTFDHVYLAPDAGTVDLSSFCHRPLWRVCHARCQITAEKAQELELRLTTCGGVHLWLDRELQHRFEPFDRNTFHTSTFTLGVSKGTHELTVRFEDLHERDTRFGFRLELLNGEGISTAISCAADEKRLAEAVAALEGLRTAEVFHHSNDVRLTSDALPFEPVMLTCPDLPGQGGPLSQSAPYVPFVLPAGCPVLTFEVEVGGVTLSRSLGTTVLPASPQLDATGLVQRKTGLLIRQDSGDSVESVLVALARGNWSEANGRALESALHYVEDRLDCADFRMMALLWIWQRYRAELPEPWADRLGWAIRGFRYWVDEPGNDVMWFWSENHVLCFHVAQHLAGQMFQHALFEASGKSGREQDTTGKARLHKWFDAVEEHGLAEWNSAAYYPINFRALLTLFELTEDPALRKRAQQLLDRICAMVALHQCGGVAAGSQGRMYEKELLAGPMTQLTPIASVLFGGRHVPGWDAAAAMLALSGYEPPQSLQELAWPKPGARIEALYTQGVESADISLLKTADFQLSCVQHHKPGDPGHQQHVAELHFAANELARVWVNHPGELTKWGDGRPSYWAGNGRLPDVVRSGSTILMRYKLNDSDLPFVHAFLPADVLDDLVQDGPWLFFRSARGYGALWGSQPFHREETGQYRSCEWRLFGRELGCAILAGSEDLDGSFDRFQERCRAHEPRWDSASAAIELPGANVVADGRAERSKPFPIDPQISVPGSPFFSWVNLRDELYATT